ncbi:MAG: EAL domain-containing protein [Actinomycetota bacterium]|nr:EAL domain-containing protein [Actinomycetota bacterium]
MANRSWRARGDVLFDGGVFVVGLLVAALAVAAWVAGGPQPRISSVLVAALTVVMSRFPLVLTQRTGDVEIGFEASILVFLSLTSPPVQALALWSIGMLIGLWFQPRRLRARAFNIGITLSSGSLLIAVVAYAHAHGFRGALELAMVIAGCAVYFLFDLLITAVSLSFEASEPLRSAIRWRSIPLGLLCFVGVDTVGYLGVLLFRTEPSWTLLLLLAPVGTILFAAQAVSRSRSTQQRLTGLFEASTQAPEWLDEQEGEHALVEQAERILHHTRVEVRNRPAAGDEIGTELDVAGSALRYVVATRTVRALRFDADDQRALDALTAVGAASLNRRRLADQMQYLARHDVLTGLVNRGVFSDRLDHALQMRRQPGDLAVLYCDLDGFKSINDRLGHAAGDQLLVAVAERVRGCLRPADTASRLGGDEFAILLEGMSAPNGAQVLADRVLTALRPTFVVAGQEVSMQASIGIAYATDERRGVDLLRNADTAMYRAKAMGKGRSELFHPVMRRENLQRIELEEELRRVVESGAIEVAFQPIVDLFSGRIDGFEVLARWTHSRLGPVSPEVFIPMAEQLGLIRQLGAQVLEHGHAAGVVLWERCGRAFTVGVNISPAQVTDPDLLARVARLMAAAPEVHLVLELTEGTLLADDAETSAALTALQAAGAGLAVDDFGVGYSSIGYLHRLPVTIVKIDKSFIAGLWDDRARTLVQGVIAMAEAMDLGVVAEGIEDWVTAATVRDMGCRLGQGFLLARPLTLDQAVEAALGGPVDVSALSTVRPVRAVGRPARESLLTRRAPHTT